jgi:heme/copper-type cytochrome/quinol oxidase subunit 2
MQNEISTHKRGKNDSTNQKQEKGNEMLEILIVLSSLYILKLLGVVL